MEVTWTNLRRQRMRAEALIQVLAAGGYTGISYVGAQAPEIAFPLLKPIFGAMARTYKVAS